MHRFSRFFAVLLLLLVFAVRTRGQDQAAATATLEGAIVNDIDGSPIPGARVKTGRQFAEPFYARTDDKGHFVFTGLSLGVYRLVAEAPGFLRNYEARDQRSPRGLLYLVPSGGDAPVTADIDGVGTLTKSPGAHEALHATLAIRLTPYAVITGKVTEAHGVPRAHCEVAIRARQAGSAAEADGLTTVKRVFTDDCGEYRAARLLPGAYYVVADKHGQWMTTRRVLRTTYYPSALDAASARPIQLAAGQQVRADIRMLVERGVSVSGTIATPASDAAAAGQTLSTHMLLYQPAPAGKMPRPPATVADFIEPIDGRFEFRNVMPGEYTLMALMRAGDDSKGTPVSAALQRVAVDEDDVDGLQVALEPVRDVTGTVTFAPGCAAVPLRVTAHGSNSLGVSRGETIASASGDFVLSGLTPSRHGLEVQAQSPDLAYWLTAARLGDRDVHRDGFDYPVPAGETLQLTVDCTKTGAGR
jgi:hypothetical protein